MSQSFFDVSSDIAEGDLGGFVTEVAVELREKSNI